MDLDFFVNLVIGQVGEEKAKEVLDMLADKVGDDKIFILKKLGKRGVCIISTDGTNCKINFPDEKYIPNIIDLEKIVRGIEI